MSIADTGLEPGTPKQVISACECGRLMYRVPLNLLTADGAREMTSVVLCLACDGAALTPLRD